ncbi:MAG: adenosylcobinamide-GDP ribazoletransferase [Motiliproteus sp.]
MISSMIMPVEQNAGPLRSLVQEPLILALQFLTRIPMPDIGIVKDEVVGRSLLFYPLVGLLIGSLLWLAQALFNWLWPDLWGLQAALLLSLWCLLTGGLHLDGLADSADAWVGGFGSRDKTLALMKDPTCGPAAVMLLLLVLVIKYSAIEVLIAQNSLWLLVVPVVGRCYLLLLFLTTDYVRAGGLGSTLTEQMPRKCSVWLLLVCALLLLLAGSAGFAVLLLSLVCFYGLRRLMQKRLGGTTGDTAGALLELVEVAALLAVLI